MSLFFGAHALGGLVMALILVVHARMAGSELELETRRADCLRDALTCRRKKHEGLESLHDALVEELAGTKISLRNATAEVDEQGQELLGLSQALANAESEIGHVDDRFIAAKTQRDDLVDQLGDALEQLTASEEKSVLRSVLLERIANLPFTKYIRDRARQELLS